MIHNTHEYFLGERQPTCTTRISKAKKSYIDSLYQHNLQLGDTSFET